jgi:hypothetical protein
MLKESTTAQSPIAHSKAKADGGMSAYQWTSPNTGRDRESAVNRPRRVGTLHDVSMLYEALVLASGKAFTANTQKYDFQYLKEKEPQFQELQKLSGIGGAGKGWGSTTQVMIGVLHVADSDAVYAAHSGAPRTGFEEVCKVLGFRYAPPLQDSDTFFARDGQPVVAPYRTGAALSDYKCAAPRLIQAALKKNEYPYSMSEIWFDPGGKHAGYENQHTIESCDTCRDRVVFMLCPP